MNSTAGGVNLEAIDALLEKACLTLEEDERGLMLSDGRMSVRPDFSKMTSRLAPARLNRELLVRVAKVKQSRRPGGERAAATQAGVMDQSDESAPCQAGPDQQVRPLAIDATAGFGEDSLLLAAAGFEVRLYERNPVIALLLQDEICRAADDPRLAFIVARMSVTNADSVEALASLDDVPDVVLLDPMFPGKQKNAQVKKKLQLLQRLERPCDDEAALLDAALSSRAHKVIVKRPVKGPYLAGRKPSYSLAGKAVRYDCIVQAR